MPLPVVQLDTGLELPEVYAFRDRLVAEWGLDFRRELCPPEAAIDPTLPPASRAAARKTEGRKALIRRDGYKGILVGVRRDEQAIRAKERVFSPRSLDGFAPAPPPVDRPLRLPVQNVDRFDGRRIIVGRIESGMLRVGDTLLFSPANRAARVASIEQGPGGRARGLPRGYVRADLVVCEARDPKALYRRARAGEIAEFTGVSSPYEPPEAPDLVIDTTSESIEACVDRLADYVERHTRPGQGHSLRQAAALS